MVSLERGDASRSRNYLGAVAGRSGLYLVAQRHSWEDRARGDADTVMSVKVGIARDLEHRLNSYLLYWPDGMYVFGIVLCNDIADARWLETNVHEYLNAKYRYHALHHTHDEEWFTLSARDIARVLATIEANAYTVFPSDDPDARRRDRRVFPYRSVMRERTLVMANRNARTQPRIGTMSETMKNLIDWNTLQMLTPVQTGARRARTVRRRTSTRGRPNNPSFI